LAPKRQRDICVKNGTVSVKKRYQLQNLTHHQQKQRAVGETCELITRGRLFGYPNNKNFSDWKLKDLLRI